MNQISYNYYNVPIGGGGYVTGIEFDGSKENILYIRTDIGGLYRFDRSVGKWISLMDFVTEDDLSETYPAAVCSENGALYSICGVGDYNSKLCISYDYGKSFEYKRVPARVHGNFSGRGTGSRLTVKNGIIYYASSYDGILKSDDNGESWVSYYPFGERCMTFIHADDSGKRIIASSAGLQNMPSDKMRGHSLFVSYDSMKTFEKLSQPDNILNRSVPLSGLTGHRISSDNNYVYITMNCSGDAKWNILMAYSCDAGCINKGVVLRYKIGKDGRLGGCEDITPKIGKECGFGGISSEHGILAVSTMYSDEEHIYISYDCGDSWTSVLNGTDDVGLKIPYMKPENNEGSSIIHWISDVKINPYNKNEAWFNTGTGIFRTENLCSDKPVFCDCCCGIEETVHLNVYSPPSGDVMLIDILGDLGGFAFTDIRRFAGNTFTDEDNKRYITCINADFPDNNPNLTVVTARGNWRGTTRGGLIISRDQCRTFDFRPELPFGLSEKLDVLFHRIERPNVNAGWAAISADGVSIVWCVADRGNILPSDCVVYSNNMCESYGISLFLDRSGKKFIGNVKVFSDRLKPKAFYGFGSYGTLFISEDGGAVFRQIDSDLPDIDFGRIDGDNKTDIKPDMGKSGVFYVTACGVLYKLCFGLNECKVLRLSASGDRIMRIGLGIKGKKYLGADKMLYITGWIGGKYGFYSSDNDGKSWIRINTDMQMFGEINAVEGDSRVEGRFYLGTGSRGLICGERI